MLHITVKVDSSCRHLAWGRGGMHPLLLLRYRKEWIVHMDYGGCFASQYFMGNRWVWPLHFEKQCSVPFINLGHKPFLLLDSLCLFWSCNHARMTSSPGKFFECHLFLSRSSQGLQINVIIKNFSNGTFW